MKKYEEPEFIKMRKDGHSLKEIGERFGKSPKTIFDWVRRAAAKGLVSVQDHRPWTPEDKAELRELKLSGMPSAEIAKKINRTKRAVEHHAHMLSISGTSIVSPWTPERDAILIAGYRDNLSIATIAKRLGGATPGSIAGRAARLKLKKSPDYSTTIRKKANRSYDTVAAAARARKGQKLARPKMIAQVVEPEVIPDFARPWLTRIRGECSFPYGPRGNVHSCCKPTWRETTYCEAHAGLCFHEKKAA